MKKFYLKAASAVLALALVPSIALAGGNIIANGPNVSVSTFTGAFHNGQVGSVNNNVNVTSGNTVAEAPAKNPPSGNIEANGGFVGVSMSAVTAHNGKIKTVHNGGTVNTGGVTAETY